MAKRMIRWGIAGVGKISSDFAYAISITEGASLAAVGGRDAKRAEAFASKCSALPGLSAPAPGGGTGAAPPPKAYGSYAELAADPDVDVVYVGTTNQASENDGRVAPRLFRAS